MAQESLFFSIRKESMFRATSIMSRTQLFSSGGISLIVTLLRLLPFPFSYEPVWYDEWATSSHPSVVLQQLSRDQQLFHHPIQNQVGVQSLTALLLAWSHQKNFYTQVTMLCLLLKWRVTLLLDWTNREEGTGFIVDAKEVNDGGAVPGLPTASVRYELDQKICTNVLLGRLSLQ